MTSRRRFVGQAAASAFALAPPAARWFQLAPDGFVDIVRAPDRVVVEVAPGDRVLRLSGSEWRGDDGIVVTTAVSDHALRIRLHSPSVAVRRIRFRWRGSIPGTPLILGDAWERGYGDLEWRGWVPDRVMPWYFATHDGARTHSYGVRTGPAACCWWRVDRDGISLCADVRSGSEGVSLGSRTLDVCDVVSRMGIGGESAFAALHAFCRRMCVAPRLPSQPVYGSNDWYSTYGDNSAMTVGVDTQHTLELSPSGGNRPVVVIDDGWQPGGGKGKDGLGLWDQGNEKFPDMPALADSMRRAGARPGIWIRPLQAAVDTPASWRLPRDRSTLDPTCPGSLQKVLADVRRLREWGFELIKHDYSTFDILGRWGFQMGSALTRDGWTFAAGPVRTTAEVLTDFYRTVRAAAGDSLVIGCNTVSHLSAGHFEICRIGDDTSGTEWSRTRKMGVNSLAFRAAQHGAFYVADPDCVGVTTAVPWSLNRQWLDLVARSGTMLSVSLASDALGPEQRRDLKAALVLAAVRQPLAEPLDWLHAVYPSRWRMMGRDRTFDWVGPDGAGEA